MIDGGINPSGKTNSPKSGHSNFRKALLWTAIPISALAVSGWVLPGSVAGGVFLASLLLIGLAIPVAIVLAFARKGEIAAGILAGAGIGFVVFFASCFAKLATSGLGF